MYINGLYAFDLTVDEADRSQDVSWLFNGRPASLGGLSLPIQNVTPKQPKYEIKSRNWASKESFGRKSKSKTVRKNKDRSTTTIEEITYLKPDGTRVRETSETTVDSSPVSALLSQENPYPTLLELFNAAEEKYRGSRTITVSTTNPLQFPRSTVRTTVTTPPLDQTEEVTQETTIFSPITGESMPGESKVASKTTTSFRRVRSDIPKYFSKPVVLRSITGVEFIQYLTSTDRDIPYHNDEMASDGSGNSVIETLDSVTPGQKTVEQQETTLDPGSNTKITKILSKFIDADGNTNEEVRIVEEPLIDPLSVVEQEINEAGKQVTKTVRNGQANETTITTTFNGIGQKLREVKSTTIRSPIEEKTTTNETSSDGTSSTRESIRTVDANGKETLNETETVKRNQNTFTTTRSDSYNYDEGIRTITLTKVTVGVTGTTTTDEKSFRISLNQTAKSVEEITEQREDDLIDHIVYGHFITEFEFSGDVLEPSLVQKLATKNFEHQQAWAMYELLEQQLELSDRITPAAKKKLYIDQYQIFAGAPGTLVRGGPVLDRISLDVFGEEFSQGCVFSPLNGFRPEYIPGTDQMYRWTLSVRVYRPIVNKGPITLDDWSDVANNITLPLIAGVYGPTT